MILHREGNRLFGSEQDTVQAILNYLLANRYPAIHHRNVGAIMRRRGRLFFGRQRFNQRGIADIICCVEGFAVAIEVKRFDGELSKDQKDWLAWWESAGGKIMTARHVEDVVTLINSLRAEVRAVPKGRVAGCRP